MSAPAAVYSGACSCSSSLAGMKVRDGQGYVFKLFLQCCMPRINTNAGTAGSFPQTAHIFMHWFMLPNTQQAEPGDGKSCKLQCHSNSGEAPVVLAPHQGSGQNQRHCTNNQCTIGIINVLMYGRMLPPVAAWSGEQLNPAFRTMVHHKGQHIQQHSNHTIKPKIHPFYATADQPA